VPTVFLSGGFDDLRSRDVRFLEEAAKLGPLTVGLWTDELVQARDKRRPKFPFEERLYLLQALRHVAGVVAVGVGDLLLPGSPEKRPGSSRGLRSALDDLELRFCVVGEGGPWPELKPFCEMRGIEVRTMGPSSTHDFPPLPPLAIDATSSRPRVLVTGCFDWFHSGHVRFFDEASAFGELYVGVGSDANIRKLKGDDHPFLSEAERAYMVQAVRRVRQAFIATGSGWVDAAPEAEIIKPRFYVVNEDGDRPEKREFCRKKGIEYIVLSRRPKPGLPARTSTALRGS
jgi:cytidyltransferase-like protein